MFCYLFFVFLLFNEAFAAKHAKPVVQWQTLSGDAPLVIARGGYSGLFPDSSQFAYQFALSTSLSDVVLFCDLQLTKDGAGFCHSGLQLDNSTTISQAFPKGQKTYPVNGEDVTGWFAIDYVSKVLFDKVSLIQGIFSRPSVFDNSQSMMRVEDVVAVQPPLFWLNVEYANFFKQHKLDIAEYTLGLSNQMPIDFISSPEINFLKGLSGKVNARNTRLIFKFLKADKTEPSTKKTYSSLLKDLPMIKSFSSGILVPKEYIWPVGKDLYLEPATTLVLDAHKLGLEVYAYGFANDAPASYNYSYDPSTEYLQFVDNSDFSVDGVLTDFPSTASQAVACLAHNKKNIPPPIKDKPLIISHNGASGVYAGCTDLAYQQAVNDGADIIDCSVQMTKDGVAFCLDSADVSQTTTAMTSFMSHSTVIPEIQKDNGIYSFDLTWAEIQTLKPSQTRLPSSGLSRNPAMQNAGKLMTLPEFLDFAKNSSVPGILISIENAAYLASKQGLDIVNTVMSNLTAASYDQQTLQQVYIQSDDTSVLEKFKSVSTYKRVLMIKESISDAPKPSVTEIKQFADAVNLPRSSLVAYSDFFLSGFTPVAKEMFAANISVFVSVLRNEFMALAFDYFSDPTVEVATYVLGLGLDGVVTEYPATASSYMRSPCFYSDADLPYTILAAQPGSLLQLAPPDALPPAQPPAPVLQPADVDDPPLPPVVKNSNNDPAHPSPPASSLPSSPPNHASLVTVTSSLSFFIVFFSFMYLHFSCH
ncbi:glycerophosphodiester phosphodiesterase GDPDL6-like [Dioscorea cayenensis subsp. rotundata]|uniref:glycerophosphodiester phosphodiesterase n=1 Tax=Dioscorea cayennensis subsp. rotundata TaxID=55577 RepID=A0AB40C105_DIOCR|nr:glycerophosphodiester phosphodiesterase GDPDL6-like [Dioscorea cayenensis subsp. rotundata]